MPKRKTRDYVNVRIVPAAVVLSSLEREILKKKMAIAYKTVYYEVQIKCNGCFVCV